MVRKAFMTVAGIGASAVLLTLLYNNLKTETNHKPTDFEIVSDDTVTLEPSAEKRTMLKFLKENYSTIGQPVAGSAITFETQFYALASDPRLKQGGLAINLQKELKAINDRIPNKGNGDISRIAPEDQREKFATQISDAIRNAFFTLELQSQFKNVILEPQHRDILLTYRKYKSTEETYFNDQTLGPRDLNQLPLAAPIIEKKVNPGDQKTLPQTTQKRAAAFDSNDIQHDLNVTFSKARMDQLLIISREVARYSTDSRAAQQILSETARVIKLVSDARAHSRTNTAKAKEPEAVKALNAVAAHVVRISQTPGYNDVASATPHIPQTMADFKNRGKLYLNQDAPSRGALPKVTRQAGRQGLTL